MSTQEDAVQEAVDATSTAYTEDAHTDVEERLRAELVRRGIAEVDAVWVREVATGIRSGHGVEVGGLPKP